MCRANTKFNVSFPRGVVIFDVDGTLVAGPEHGPSAGFVAMHQAASEVAKVELGDKHIDFAGLTDSHIAQILLEEAGLSANAQNIADVLKKYLIHMHREVIHRPYRPLGDPVGAVYSLESEGFICGLGTGNLRMGAQLKLRSAGIFDLFHLELGGYADDHHLRPALIEIAARRCDPARELPVFVVGDTVHDVHAAKAIGARCIGVPFGKNRREMLEQAGADQIVDAIGPCLVPLCNSLLSR